MYGASRALGFRLGKEGGGGGEVEKRGRVQRASERVSETEKEEQ